MASPWLLTGNASTNPNTDFVGTSDNQPLVIKTNGAERIRVNASGKVGIGITDPAALLSLGNYDGIRELVWDGDPNGTQDGNCGFGINLGAPNCFDIFMGHATSALNIAVPTGPWPFPGYSAKLTVTASGNVGIGTTTPSTTLEVNKGANVGGGIIIDGSNDTRLTIGAGQPTVWSWANGWATAGDLSLIEEGVSGSRIYVKPGGNVGIGTTAPTEALSVNGNVTVTGDVLLTGADCAEEFETTGTEPPEPGTVVVIDEGGALRESRNAYDKKVAGVVSGAGEYRHALLLDKKPSDEQRIPVALVGKVYCKVDAQYSPIEVGDLLTTSATPGHAMKAADSVKAFGSVIGKALRPLRGGHGLIPILVSLQ
jgi:hypothetical protein